MLQKGSQDDDSASKILAGRGPDSGRGGREGTGPFSLFESAAISHSPSHPRNSSACAVLAPLNGWENQGQECLRDLLVGYVTGSERGKLRNQSVRPESLCLFFMMARLGNCKKA